jgi:hypothetical protein
MDCNISQISGLIKQNYHGGMNKKDCHFPGGSGMTMANTGMKPDAGKRNQTLFVNKNEPAAMKACPGTGMVFSWFFFDKGGRHDVV